MKNVLKPRSGTRVPLYAAGVLVLSILLASCGGGGYGGGGGMSGSGGTLMPGAMSLSSPADGMMGVGATPTLMWTPSANAADYRVQVELATGNFTGTLLINTTVGSMTASFMVPMTANLVLGTQYHWRVIAENIYGQSTAGPFTFTP